MRNLLLIAVILTTSASVFAQKLTSSLYQSVGLTFGTTKIDDPTGMVPEDINEGVDNRPLQYNTFNSGLDLMLGYEIAFKEMKSGQFLIPFHMGLSYTSQKAEYENYSRKDLCAALQASLAFKVKDFSYFIGGEYQFGLNNMPMGIVGLNYYCKPDVALKFYSSFISSNTFVNYYDGTRQKVSSMYRLGFSVNYYTNR